MADTITVNVADQAFPPPPPTSQNLPENLGVLVQGSEFAAPFAAFPAQGLRPFTPVFVVDQGTVPVIDSGVPVPIPSNVFITDDGSIGQPAEYIVSPTAGNFQTGLPVLATIIQSGALADAATGGPITASTVVVQLTLTQSLTQYGLDFYGKEIVVLSVGVGGDASNSGAVRTITNWSQNILYFNLVENGASLNGALPMGPGATYSLPVQRESDEVVYDLLGQSTTSFPSNIAQNDPVANSQGAFQGNVTASSGVVSPFIGSGIQLPPFIGTFEVENQPVLGGLPVNVFVG